MVINLQDIDTEKFYIKDGEFCGEPAKLINPIGNIKFDQKNKKFRSSIWSTHGELLSASFKKFVNYGENEENFPSPKSLLKTNALLKCDGSTLIVNRRNGLLNTRTRGTFNTSTLENGWEIEYLIDKYPTAFDNEKLNVGNCSFIYEWCTPTNIIVVKHEEPKIVLLNIIKHEDYSYYTQDELDSVAEELNLLRPTRYNFDSMESLISSVKLWEEDEGICLYHSNDQEITKIKADKYLFIHSMKFELNTIEKVIDLFLKSECTNYNEFYEYVCVNIDYEVAQFHISNISRVCDARKEVLRILDGMKSYIDKLSGMTRKEQAAKILSSYGSTNRSGMVFTLLDGKTLNNEQLKKLYFQVLNK